MRQRQPRIERERAVEKSLAVNGTAPTPEHVSQISLNLGVAQGRGLHLRLEPELLGERHVFRRIQALGDVISQLLLDGRIAGLERLPEAEVGRFALRQRVDELAELKPPSARAQQVMGERPRLGVKEALLFSLDVKRRSLIDRQQGFEGYQLTGSEQPRVTRDGCPQPAILPSAGHFKRAEVFGQSLAGPGWKRGAERRGERAAARQRMD